MTPAYAAAMLALFGASTARRSCTATSVTSAERLKGAARLLSGLVRIAEPAKAA